jgi:bifunctional non-homologous end joining protein LigD
MALEEYRQKRDFERTPEPAGSPPSNGGNALRFVVQKHKASHLHYDFRLELDGVLKSWAVPKGPSMQAGQKKLAMMVEDHPIEYRDFEGIIPKGEYGGGTVMVWDEGTYHAPGVTSRQESEKLLREGIRKGDLKFILEGHKLKGAFALVRMHKADEPNSWLLIKKEDEYTTEADILEKDTSVLTEATIDEIHERETNSDSPKIWRSNRGQSFDISKINLEGAQKGKRPDAIDPMLATLAEEPFDKEGWLFEIKWDGFRAIAESGPAVRLYSRHNIDYEAEFSTIVDELKQIGFDAVLDGEIVVVDSEGRADFKLLQNYRRTGEGLLVYYVFDILYLEGYDLRRLTLERRKSILKQVLPELKRIKYSDHIEEHGIGLFRLAVNNKIEGMIGKDKNSFYRTGVRSKEWLKIKTYKHQEVVIGGFTEPRGSRNDMGALLLGVYENNALVYVGHTGGGFDEASLAEVRKKLEPLITEQQPFKEKPKPNAPPTWIKPELVCEVRFSDWTQDGLMRQPIYMGMREDKDPKDVHRELPLPVAEALARKKTLRFDTKRETVAINGHEVVVSNLSKIYFPADVITKGEVIEYYRRIAPMILPYLIDRPQSLNRFPNGIKGKSFFQKDINDAPPWVKTLHLDSESQPQGIDYLLCQDEATLVYMVNLGSIEINPWNSRFPQLDSPDFLVIDLDPEGRSFNDVIDVALGVKKVFDQIEVPCFPKTSGKRGIHIDVPLGALYTYEQTRQFASIIARLINEMFPDLTSVERSPKVRQKKIYVDFLQNRRGQTMAAPYSLRPVDGAPVSTPLKWEEVKHGLSPQDFTIKNIEKRLEKVGDLWKGVLGPGIDMAKSLALLKKAWKNIG